ncbi:methylamine utilization protein [Frateuria sp. STR12]|uniref:methylamine utilization protein n=1 Tax=Frateuria hangzhouensis TaxID=2995589 RepID=UPI00226081CA|nr:methylamine utilization protein [Frateuria sp. STR12]MCX7512218.1 methylamine utilization protein [Frateuria sp. STR12]
MRWRLMLAWLLAGSAGTVWAGQLVVRVSDTNGRAVGDAVVTLTSATAATGVAAAPVTRYVDQRDETFIPYVQVVRPGDRVVFRNSDGTRHHVYSFSDAKAFELLLHPGESSPPLTLDKAGLVAIGCNIHDHMIAYLLVSPARARVTPSQGQVVFAHLPSGKYTVTVWHPQLRPGQAPPSEVKILATEADAQRADFALSLIPDPRELSDREHVDY